MPTDAPAPMTQAEFDALVAGAIPAIPERPLWNRLSYPRRAFALAAVTPARAAGGWLPYGALDVLFQAVRDPVNPSTLRWAVDYGVARGWLAWEPRPHPRVALRMLRAEPAGLPARRKITRKPGGGLPPDGVGVMRPRPYGNPFALPPKPTPADREQVVAMYRAALAGTPVPPCPAGRVTDPGPEHHARVRAAARAYTPILAAAKYLGCACPADRPCHADEIVAWLRRTLFPAPEAAAPG